MKILVAIANYGTRNRKYVERLLSEYGRMTFQVDVVILSNEPKEFGKDVEVLVGLPSKNPWSLPFAHKALFATRMKDYDLFIYTEDDTLITERNVRAFLDSSHKLPDNEIPGFLRYESGKDGTRYISSAHGGFHWKPRSAKHVGADVFAQFTNAHSACFILTRRNLEQAIASGGFLVPPYEGDYDMLCSAATDPYTRCGFTKVVNISRIEDFLLPHLPNKYIGTMGADSSAFLGQVEALKQIATGRRSAFDLLRDLQVPVNSPWAKSYYEPCRQDVISLVPKGCQFMLSIGMGSGATECELSRRGLKVTAIPIDSVISAPAECNGVELVHCEIERAAEILRNRCFDCVLFQNFLYLVEKPEALILGFSRLLREGGYVLVSEPNFGNIQTCARRILGRPGFQNLGSFARGGVTRVTLRRLLRWVKAAGLTIQETVHTHPETASARLRSFRYLPHRFSSRVVTVLAQRNPITG